MRVLVTGAAGSIGSRVCELLVELDVCDVIGWDIADLDVTDSVAPDVVAAASPDVVLHLAGAKSAPSGELSPLHTTAANVVGTANVLAGAALVGARVVTASTCKACDPETVYGASKLVAERLTLNAGGSVVRFFNVPESSGNVFRLWEGLPRTARLPVCDAYRYFVSLESAASLMVDAITLPAGRYSPDPGLARHMPDVAAGLYPGREQVEIPLRRGDRRREPLVARSEKAHVLRDGLMLVVGRHDPVASDVAVAA